MTFTKVKIKWAKKLLGAKYFVVMTDKESAIALDGADPESFTDYMALTAQAAEVDEFYLRLGELVKRHQKAVKQFTGDTSAKTATLKKKSKRPATKIDVKEG